ncbi:MAG: GNAT family N-acetyltransferase [Bacillales bacterium]|jgi:ribosomal protein S18 acetylase RimI-like enzyme|nr:GNAT family N-acetyltransferase [Bacillales bacterium]
MRKLSLEIASIADLDLVYEIMIREFGLDDLYPKEKFIRLLEMDKYDLYLLKEDDNLVGYAFLYSIDEQEVVWIDYLGINEKYQDHGYGSLFFNLIRDTLGKNHNLILEVDIPKDLNDVNLDSNRRIVFYEKLGCFKLDINYILPIVKGGLPLYLFAHQASKSLPITNDTLKGVVNSVFTFIQADIPTMPKYREIVLNSLK